MIIYYNKQFLQKLKTQLKTLSPNSTLMKNQKDILKFKSNSRSPRQRQSEQIERQGSAMKCQAQIQSFEMSQSSMFMGQNNQKSICSPQVSSLLSQCQFLEELVQKSKQEKNSKIKFLLKVIERREQTLREVYFQNLRLKEERHILIEQIANLESQLNQDDENNSPNGSLQPRISELTDLRHFFNQIRIQSDAQFMGDEIDVDNMTYEQILQLEEHIGYVNRGLSQEQISSIPKSTYKDLSTKKDQQAQICTVCQQDFEMEDKCRQLQCNHYYHSKCIKQWLKKEKHCPVCKQEQQFVEVIQKLNIE